MALPSSQTTQFGCRKRSQNSVRWGSTAKSKQGDRNKPAQIGRGAADILFLSKRAFHKARLKAKVLGLSSLAGPILPG